MEKISFGGASDAQSKKKKKKKPAPTSGFNIIDDESGFRAETKPQVEQSKLETLLNIKGSDFLRTNEDDDIKPVIVTDIPAERLEEILNLQKEGEINKVRKQKLKEAKKAAKQKQSQWVEIDDEGNKVKAFIGNYTHNLFRKPYLNFIETGLERKEKQRLERKERKREVKRRFLEEQMKKKQRKQELEEKLLGIKPEDFREDEEDKKPKRQRLDTESEGDEDLEKELGITEPKTAPKTASDGMISGLQSVEQLKQGLEQNKRSTQINETEAFDQLKGQKTVYRDKDGKVITDNEMSNLVVSKKDKLRQMNQERLNMWSKGLVQTQGRADRGMEELKAKDEGQEYDRLVDEEFQKAQRFGDPMKEIKKYQKGKASAKDKSVLWSRKVFPP
jgi:hypothetical protein